MRFQAGSELKLICCGPKLPQSYYKSQISTAFWHQTILTTKAVLRDVKNLLKVHTEQAASQTFDMSNTSQLLYYEPSFL